MSDNAAKALADQAATAVERARESGASLDLFGQPDPGAPVQDGSAKGKTGRPPGAKNKASTALRDLLAARGYADPASRLAHMAGLNTRDDPRLVAVGFAEAILEAAGATKEQRRKRMPDLVVQLLREMRQAQDALMPYVFGKITPDLRAEAQNMVVQIMATNAGAQAGAPGFGPPPMPEPETVENQQLSDPVPPGSDK